MKIFWRNTFSKPKIILFLVFLFFCVSFFAFIIGFEMYLNDKELLENKFKKEEFWFYTYFISIVGFGLFFFFLGKSLFNYKKWSWFFLVGSVFISLISVLYKLMTIFIVLLSFELSKEILNILIINMIYSVIYIYLLQYFLEEKIKNLFTN
jgi:hypothetical protein